MIEVKKGVEKPPFYQEINGEFVEHNLKYNRVSERNFVYKENLLAMCPYTEYIPLKYVYSNVGDPIGYTWPHMRTIIERSSTASVADAFPKLIRALFQNNPPRIFTPLVMDAICQFMYYGNMPRYTPGILTENFVKRINEAISKYLRRDDKEVWCSNISAYTKTEMMAAITRMNPIAYTMRSYQGQIGCLSMIINHEPAVMACTLPEDYMNHRAAWMMDKVLDTSKVVVFVDKELDNPEYPIPAAREFYRKHVEPFLKSTKAAIFKVPLEFIKEKCFLSNEVELQSTKIKDKKEELDKMIDAFLNGLSAPQQEPSIVSEMSRGIDDVSMWTTRIPDTRRGVGVYEQILRAGEVERITLPTAPVQGDEVTVEYVQRQGNPLGEPPRQEIVYSADSFNVSNPQNGDRYEDSIGRTWLFDASGNVWRSGGSMILSRTT
jgi:hypothetical protein